MAFKLNISAKDGKTFKLESESDSLVGKSLGEIIQGSELSADLGGYELRIAGASDIAGFPHKSDEEGPQLRKVLLVKGWGMHKRPKKEGKKPVSTPKGFRKRKTVRGKVLSEKTVQINLLVEKEGTKKLPEVFPDQNKAPETTKKAQEAPKEEVEKTTEQQVEDNNQEKETPAEKQTTDNPEENKEENKQ